MVNKKSNKVAQEPTTLNPDMKNEIMKLMREQGIELDDDAIKMLNEVAGQKFEETYTKLAEEKAKNAKLDENVENMEQEPAPSDK